jgi:hypothetical protein
MTDETKLHPSKRSQFNAYNFLVCWLVSLGQVAFGHPASVIGVTLGEPPFLAYMGLVDAKGVPTSNSAALIGTMNGVFQVRHSHINPVNVTRADIEIGWRGIGYSF